MIVKTAKNRPLVSDNHWFLFAISVVLYGLLYFYHGFLAYGSDTIETVPYALWMGNQSLFPHDFHIQYFSSIFPNERWLISWFLHFFPENMYIASLTYHMLFSVVLIAGMIRLSDIILRNIEWSSLAVFLTLFSLYNINVGSNELYYNMFVSSLAGKSIAVWAIISWLRKHYIFSAIVLGVSTILHPLVGLQIFVLLFGTSFVNKNLKWDEISYKSLGVWTAIYLITGGIWIYFILQGQHSEISDTGRFFEIVEFRIAHHFFPDYFPKKHMLIIGLLILSSLYPLCLYAKQLFTFSIIALVGIAIYMIGLQFEWELFLSSQWMKTTIWLKFFGVIGLLLGLQKMIETKWHQLFFMVAFALALIIALIRFNPKYDKMPPGDLYAWIQLNTDQEDLFLVPPQLVDFKAMTKRSSYFDFKAMLHHQPAIFEWAKRFEEVYGIQMGDRSPSDDIFSKIRAAYAQGSVFNSNKKIDYFIIPLDENGNAIRQKFLQDGHYPIFLGEQFAVYEQKETK